MGIRRPLLAIILLASSLHILGMARSVLPAQDGLKFIRVARGFQTQPWLDVIRGSDQHPLYPALVAMAEPFVSLAIERGPTAWRVAAQLVSAIAAVLLLIPLHALTTLLFDRRIADLAALGFALLPIPMAVGHDTLSDPLALSAFVTALWLGILVLKDDGLRAAVGCGIVAGLGFLTRPEALVVPLAVAVCGLTRPPLVRRRLPRLAGMAVVFCAMVGCYALTKGQVSEKLAIRGFTGESRITARPVPAPSPWLPPGLDDPRWDFSPKDEPTETPRRNFGNVAHDLGFQWAEDLGWILGLFAIWGFVRDRHIRSILSHDESIADQDNSARKLIATYLVLFTLILARHELKMGYLSSRHMLTLVIVSLPWAAAGVFVCGRALALMVTPQSGRIAGVSALLIALGVSIALQVRPSHPSRWGHWAAGQWLAANMRSGESVLDTRGWAAFTSGRNAYDYWHVHQALSDSRLAYIVVGTDELKAGSRRADTLNAVLTFAGHPIAEFPERIEGRTPGILVYRFDRPESWEGIRP